MPHHRDNFELSICSAEYLYSRGPSFVRYHALRIYEIRTTQWDLALFCVPVISGNMYKEVVTCGSHRTKRGPRTKCLRANAGPLQLLYSFSLLWLASPREAILVPREYFEVNASTKLVDTRFPLVKSPRDRFLRQHG